jgi:hypothetical protein
MILHADERQSYALLKVHTILTCMSLEVKIHTFLILTLHGDRSVSCSSHFALMKEYRLPSLHENKGFKFPYYRPAGQTPALGLIV